MRQRHRAQPPTDDDIARNMKSENPIFFEVGIKDPFTYFGLHFNQGSVRIDVIRDVVYVWIPSLGSEAV